jgi:hypothetical protein
VLTFRISCWFEELKARLLFMSGLGGGDTLAMETIS